MKTLLGCRIKGSSAVALPQAGFSNATKKAAFSIFLIIAARNDPESDETTIPAKTDPVGSILRCI
jgi:hypothetical protein